MVCTDAAAQGIDDIPDMTHVVHKKMLYVVGECALLGCREGVVMVNTDAAARGIRIPDITRVVQKRVLYVFD